MVDRDAGYTATAIRFPAGMRLRVADVREREVKLLSPVHAKPVWIPDSLLRRPHPMTADLAGLLLLAGCYLLVALTAALVTAARARRRVDALAARVAELEAREAHHVGVLRGHKESLARVLTAAGQDVARLYREGV